MVTDASAADQAGLVSLREVTRETVRAICALDVTPEQRSFVAPNAISIAEAYFQPKAWFRAVYAGDVPVGFLMLYDDPEAPRYFLWRLMIAASHQGKGYGRQALQLLIEHVRTRPRAVALETSCVPASAGGPEPFYRSLGFEPTEETMEREIVLCLPL